jgi:hypothetical protein
VSVEDKITIAKATAILANLLPIFTLLSSLGSLNLR